MKRHARVPYGTKTKKKRKVFFFGAADGENAQTKHKSTKKKTKETDGQTKTMVSTAQKSREIDTINNIGEDVFGIENLYWILGLIIFFFCVAIYAYKSTRKRPQNQIEVPPSSTK